MDRVPVVDAAAAAGLAYSAARSEVVCGLSVEDLCEHCDQPSEIGFGSRSVACAVQLGQVGFLPVESGAAFGEEEVEELAATALIDGRTGLHTRPIQSVIESASESLPYHCR